METISRKQFAHMTDLEEEYCGNPTHENFKKVTDYQDEIGWPFKATQEQIDYWGCVMDHEPYDPEIGEYSDYFPRNIR